MAQNFAGGLAIAAVHMAGWHMTGGRFDMTSLVVKEKIRFELAQKFTLGQSTQEHGLVHLDVPFHQGADGALMRGGTARSHQSGADMHGGRALLLQAVQRC